MIGGDVECVVEFFEVSVSEYTIGLAFSRMLVVEVEIVEDESTRLETHIAVLHLVIDTSGQYFGLTVGGDFAFEIELFEWAIKVYMACGVAFEIAKDTIDIAVEKCQIGVMGGYVQAEPFFGQRYVAMHLCAIVGGVGQFHVCIDVDAVFTLVPIGMYVGMPHKPVVEREMGNGQIGMELGLVFLLCEDCLPGSSAAKRYGVKIYEIEYVVNVNAVEACYNGVVLAGGYHAIKRE